MNLNPTHYLAIELLATGESNKTIAQKLSVAPETVSKWRGDFDFQAELNTLLKSNQEATQDKLRYLVSLALETIEKVMTNSNTPAKDKITASLKILEITKTTTPQIGATNAKTLKNEQERNIVLDSMLQF